MPPEIVSFCFTYHLAIGATTTITTSDPIEKSTYTTIRIKDRAEIERTFFFVRYSKNNFFHPILAFGLYASMVGPEKPAPRNQEVHMKRILLKFIADESGATAIEYGLIAAGISLAIIATVNGVGGSLNTKFTSLNNSLK